MEPQECELVGGSGATVLVGQHFHWREPSEEDTRAYGEPRRVTCDTCEARGWLPPPVPLIETGWPRKCEFCSGKGSMSLHAIAEALDEDPGVLYRLSELRVRPKTAARLLDKILMLLRGEVSMTAKQDAYFEALRQGREFSPKET